jgi:glycosyltransferase involved in cell wall biosynthesis
MKVALVHDYLAEFGGAERVLLALSEIWPMAPIFTAFYDSGSSAWKRFSDRDIRTSWFHAIPQHSRLASPLRFLTPLIWRHFDFSKYDVVVSSANWYITKGLRKGPKTVEICYCHTPPRYLYGYPTSMEWRRYWPVRVYGEFVGHFLRMVDFQAAQRVDFFVANSHNVRRRIKKFYRRNATVIYPPVEVRHPRKVYLSGEQRSADSHKRNYYLVVSRIVGGKGLELAVEAANRLRVPLKVVGRAAGWGSAIRRLKDSAGEKVEFLGEVSDERLSRLYAQAHAFLATARDEDFGITPVEAMAHGTPVVAFKGGGYLETVIEGKTGVFFDEYTVESLVQAIQKLESQGLRRKSSEIQRQAQKFSKERFQKQMLTLVQRSLDSEPS